MAGETVGPERAHISFDELGAAIATYDQAFYAHNSALFTNKAYDDEGFATLSGQDLADWKQKFPRVDDEEIARLQEALEEVEEELISTLGLESPDVIPALREAYHNEEVRRNLERDLGPKETDPWRHAITIESSSLEPRDMITGAIAMAKLTDETYTMHGGVIQSMTYNYAYATAGPAHEVDDVLAKFSEQGLDLTAAAAA